MRKLSILACLLLMLALVSSAAFATPPDTPASQTVVTSDTSGNDDEGDKPEAKKKKRPSYRDKLDSRGRPQSSGKPKKKADKYKPWGEVLKDAEKKEGLFNVHTKREDVFFEIKEDQLDKPFVTFLSLSKGMGARFVLGGLPITGSIMFDFHRVEDHIQLRQLNTRFRATDDKALDDAIDLAYGQSVLFSLPIASENEKDKLLLVKMDDVFLSDISDMGFWLQLVLSKPVRMDKKKAIYRSVKTFPKNVEIEALLTYSPGDRRGLNLPQVPDSRFIEIGVHYSIHMLPEEPMKPRVADDRVGYFMTPHKDFSRDSNESFFVHHINRWRLEKKNPDAEISEPVKPITFYIDKTIPEHYRKYVREGIEMWQKAFEAAGFKKGIIAKDPGDDPEYDAEDARYNTIRWIISDEPSFGAIGPSRVDPRTGEIIDADILMEQNMIANFRKNYRRYAGPEALQQIDPALKYLIDPKTDENLAAELELREKFFGHTCEMTTGFMANFDFAQIALLAEGHTGMEVPEQFVGEAIKWVTAHEVGHTLGLRHNFESSISTPYEDLHNRSAIERIGMTGSVMDYASPNVSRDRGRQGYYYSPSVGTYDRWAIRYGYTVTDKRGIKEIADEAHLKKHRYGTDEDTYPGGAMDPDAQIWDLGDKPLSWAEERIGLCHDILSKGDLIGRVVTKGDNLVPLRNAVTTLLIQEYIATARAVKYVGGQYTHRPHHGDDSGQLPMEPASADEQRTAVNFIVKHGFSKDAFTVAPEILNKLQDDKLWSWQNQLFSFGRRYDYPLTNWVASLQNGLIVQLVSPMRLQRMLDAQYKQEGAYKISELFRTMTDEIWSKNMVPRGSTSAMQRNLQRMYLHHMIQMVVSPSPQTPWEAIALARLQLNRIASRIDATYAQAGLSDESNAHLGESKARITRALDAKLQAAY